jgi:hypothetical protein
MSQASEIRFCRGMSLVRLILMVSALAAAGTLEGTTVLQVAVQHNDNANLSNREIKSDRALSALIEYSNLHPINERWQAGIGALLQSSAWEEYPGLNLTEIGADFVASRKFGLGPYAPRLDLRLGLSRQFSKVSEWSGTWLRGSGTWHRRFSPAWQASLTGDYDRLYAGRQVFSTTNIGGTLRIDYDPTQDWRVSVAFGGQYGDQLSWCRASWPPFIGTNPWLDGIFGDDWFPYQKKSRAKVGEFSLARALGPDTTLSLAWEYYRGDIKPDHVYIRRNLGLRLIHAF